MDLVAALGAAVVQAPLGPAGSLARQAFGASTDKPGTAWGPAAVVTTAPAQASAFEPAPVASTGKSAMPILGALVGVSVGTMISAGVGYGLGRWLYPDTGGVPFAKVGAIGYLIPVGLWMGFATIGAAASSPKA